MSTINELLQQEIAMGAYKNLRNAPRDTINYGVRPNAIKCLAEYALLQIALAGGNESVPDISGFAEMFTAVTSPVTPFITLLQFAMRIIIDTPVLVDQMATEQEMLVLPFSVTASDPVNLEEYITMLQEAVEALNDTITLMTGQG